jgi:hypothetical protein
MPDVTGIFRRLIRESRLEPHQRRVAEEHVEQLRQLRHGPAPQTPLQRRDAQTFAECEQDFAVRYSAFTTMARNQGEEPDSAGKAD